MTSFRSVPTVTTPCHAAPPRHIDRDTPILQVQFHMPRPRQLTAIPPPVCQRDLSGEERCGLMAPAPRRHSRYIVRSLIHSLSHGSWNQVLQPLVLVGISVLVLTCKPDRSTTRSLFLHHHRYQRSTKIPRNKVAPAAHIYPDTRRYV